MATNSSPADGGAAGPVEIGVIGSARIGSDDPRYAEAERLGRALAAEHWTVVTGGYGGLMGAVASGAAAAGGHTVGLPMSNWKHLTPHASNVELRWSIDYAERLRHLMSTAAVIALPCGIGTLSEAAIVWAAAQTEPHAAQLVLVGDPWCNVRQVVGAELVVDPADLSLARCVRTVDHVTGAVREALTRPGISRGPRG